MTDSLTKENLGGVYSFHINDSLPINYSVIHPRYGVFDPRDHALSQFIKSTTCLVVVDQAVDEIYKNKISDYLNKHVLTHVKYVKNTSEDNKTLQQVESICDMAIEMQLPRNGVIVGVGGGVLLDIAGFAASIYRRGIDYIRIPTTLIGIVDVGVGIKHAVNKNGKKSIIGTFYPPLATINDIRFLATTPASDLIGGIAEIIKLAMVCDAALFDLVELNATNLLKSHFQKPSRISQEIIILSEQIMLQNLSGNLFEYDLKRTVDFGHTFSPVIEANRRFSIKHGYAVAIDMVISSALAVIKRLLHIDEFKRLLALLQSVGLPTLLSTLDVSELIAGLEQAKLHRGGQLNLVVPVGIGNATFVQTVDKMELENALALSHHYTEHVAHKGLERDQCFTV